MIKEQILYNSLMEKNKENCWDFFGCSEEDKSRCIVVKNKCGRECWLIKEFPDKITKEENLAVCKNCIWYKKLNLDN